MSSAVAADRDIKVFQSRYLRHVLIVEEGQSDFHEKVHYWQHIGTTFGAFQLIGFLIAAKAMGIAYRKLVQTKKIKLPLTHNSLKLLKSKQDLDILRRALSYRSLLERYEVQSIDHPQEIYTSSNQLYAGNPPEKSMILVKPGLGYHVGSVVITELHNFVLARLRNEKTHSGPIEKILWDRIQAFLGGGCEEIIARLCDWALMAPNPNLIEQAPGEVHPGWRLLLAIEILKSYKKDLQVLNDSYEISEFLARKLRWHGPEIVMNHYESFLDLCKKGSTNQKDAKRNREAYNAFGELMATSRDIRQKYKDAFALPHVYENVIEKRLPPLIRVKEGKLIYASDDTQGWYLSYIGTVSFLLQAFGNNSIRCAYRHFEIEDNCRYLKATKEDSKFCYFYPWPGNHDFIQCPFVDFLSSKGLENVTIQRKLGSCHSEPFDCAQDEQREESRSRL